MKTPKDNLGGSASEEFERAAQAVSGAEPQESSAGVSSPVTPPFPEVGKEVFEKISVSPEISREAVKLLFWPMAHYASPDWALTDEEADRAAPKMQKFLEWFLTRYMPWLTLRLAARYPEVLELAVALALLAWHKYQIVAALERERLAAPVPSTPSAEHHEAASDAAVFTCEVCQKGFFSRADLADHLPCTILSP